MYSRYQLADDFRRLGVASTDTVMLHASVRALGKVAGGPDRFFATIVDGYLAKKENRGGRVGDLPMMKAVAANARVADSPG